MIRAGVDVVRLNFSHGKAQDHIDRAPTGARGGAQASAARSRSWPTCRARRSASASSTNGKIDAGRRASRSCSTPRAPSWATTTRVGLDYKELPRDVKPGDTLLLNDGLIVLTVDARRAASESTPP